LSAPELWGKFCRLIGKIAVFDAQDADVALLKTGYQVRNAVVAQVDRREVERDRMSGKKALGTFETGVEVGEPIRNGRPWRNDESHVGARPKREQLALIESD
jgi:hypothetical protein